MLQSYLLSVDIIKNFSAVAFLASEDIRSNCLFLPSTFGPCLPFPFPSLPSPSSLRSRPLIAARGSEKALKLLQRVQAEPDCQTPYGTFSAYLDAFSGNRLRTIFL